MNELITVKVNKEYEQTVSARELHDKLGISQRFTDWFKYQTDRLNLHEGSDFITTLGESTGGRPSTDFVVTLDIAKHLCMVSGGEMAWKIRDYFIKVEKAWNAPEQVMARALQIANNKLTNLQHIVEAQKPKVIFAEAVGASNTSILIGDLAKILRQNGIQIGQNRLFAWMRKNNFLIKSGSSRNMPTQRSMEMGLFEVKERTINNPDGSIRITKTTKVSGRGQVYFVNRFLSDNEELAS